jgi:hypothetical protein
VAIRQAGLLDSIPLFDDQTERPDAGRLDLSKRAKMNQQKLEAWISASDC